jgi:hypothetical protein
LHAISGNAWAQSSYPGSKSTPKLGFLFEGHGFK